MFPERQRASPNVVSYFMTKRYATLQVYWSIQQSYQLQSCIIMSRILTNSTRMAQQGRISEGIIALETQLERGENNYSICNNLAALHLQLGHIQKSIQFNSKAISIDPFAYVAYYNRFLCYFVQGKLQLAHGDLSKALSCLYLLKGYEENSLKYLNKSIYYCEQNARAYLFRAKLNEGKNNKLAENDYSIAIQYAPNLAQIYQQRALFYRRIGRSKQFEQSFASYTNLRAMGAKHTAQLIENQPSEDISFKDQIIEGVKQFQDLLSKKKPNQDGLANEQHLISKLPLDSIQSTIQKKDDQQLLLSDRPDVDTAKTIEIRKEQINFRKREFDQRFNKNFEDIFQDENSKQLNDEIQKLENEIKAEGGKLSLEENQQLDISDPSNFLTAQIEKAIEQITKLSNKDTLNDVKSVRSANSNASAKSRQSDNRQLTVDQFRILRKMQFEVISLEDLDNPSRKQVSKVVLRYKDQSYETAMNKFEWREKFTIPLEADGFELQVEAIQKGGVFRASTSIGEGSVNLLDCNQSKCILGSKDKKTAILYYKLELI